MNPIRRYLIILTGLLLGAVSLSLFSILQKSLVGLPLTLNGFIIPLSYGGAIGVVISLFVLRSKRLYSEMAKKEREHQNQVLTAQFHSEEQERKRLGQELHDGLGPLISSVKMYFQMLSSTKDEEKRKIIIENGTEGLNEAINSLREISSNLNPYVLTHFGLEEAIRKFIEKIELNERITCTCDVQLKDNLPSQVELAIYRTSTELINNSLRHGHATEINVVITEESDGKLSFSYNDNGRGFDIQEVKDKPGGLGLFNIRNRIMAMGGVSEMKSALGKGFSFSFILPVLK